MSDKNCSNCSSGHGPSGEHCLKCGNDFSQWETDNSIELAEAKEKIRFLENKYSTLSNQWNRLFEITQEFVKVLKKNGLLS